MNRCTWFALVGFIAAAAALAQDAPGSIDGKVIDSVSRQPVKRATVIMQFFGARPRAARPKAPQSTVTDATGAFSFDNLSAGKYYVRVEHPNYPQARMGGIRKAVDVAANDAAKITLELVPGAAISGHIVDEDGDPMNGCIVRPHPAKNFNAGIPMLSITMSHEDGSYRVYNIPAGQYTITAQCSQAVFQPRPLSAGPDPPPTEAYPRMLYPAATELKSAQIVELAPGAEKSGLDFQMRPVPVTTIHGAVIAGSADWRGRSDLRVALAPLDRGLNDLGLNDSSVNPKDGTFEIQHVFPGSYRLIVFSQNFSRGAPENAGNRVGAVLRVDVADKPLEVSLQLNRAIDVSGSVEMDSANSNTTGNSINPGQLGLQLQSEDVFGPPPPLADVKSDGSFTIKSVLPGEWRIRLVAPMGFIKSAWLGSDDVTNRPLDLTAGSAAPLRLLVSTDTATIEGTAPPGQTVFVSELDGGGGQGRLTDSSGKFTFKGLSPGKYRVVVTNPGEFPAGDAGHEITVAEGETATVDLTAEAKP